MKNDIIIESEIKSEKLRELEFDIRSYLDTANANKLLEILMKFFHESECKLREVRAPGLRGNAISVGFSEKNVDEFLEIYRSGVTATEKYNETISFAGNREHSIRTRHR